MNILPFAVNILWKVNSKLMTDFPLDYTVLDIETTGLSPKNNEIIELSALKIRNKEVVREFSVLVNPGCHISSFITDLTGINDAMVKDALCIEDALNSFIGFIGKDKVVGHNVMFDLNFIKDTRTGLTATRPARCAAGPAPRSFRRTSAASTTGPISIRSAFAAR